MRPFSRSHAYIAESVLLDSRLALFHEQERWLAIADLDVGFELSQRVAGRLVPLWGMESIETRLNQVLRDYHPATLILSGDLVHDKSGAREFFSLVTRLRKQCDVVLLAGNHDAQIKRLRADLRDSFATDRFEFHHGDCEREQNGRIQVIGHFHPAATLHDGAGLRLKFPALVRRGGAFQSVDRFHHQKNAEGNDQEIDQDSDEIAVGKYRKAGFLCRIQRHPWCDLVRERDIVIGEVKVTENSSQWRHEKILHDGADDFSKRCADDDAYRQVNGVTFYCKFLEFFPHRIFK